MQVEPPRGAYAFKPFVAKRQVPEPASERPQARSGHRVVCDERNLYLYGGFNPSRADDCSHTSSWPLFKELWSFDFGSSSWALLPHGDTLPKHLASPVLALGSGTLFVHGGTGTPFGEDSSNDVYACATEDGRMQLVPATGERPEPQYGQAAVFRDPYLYVLGGTTGLEYSSDVHRFDTRTLFWERLSASDDPCKPSGSYKHEIAFDGRLIYMFGGGTACESFGFEDIPAFDVSTRKWMKLSTIGDADKNYPTPRRCHGLVQFTNETTGSVTVVISGGSNGSNIFDEVWSIDLSTLRWAFLKTCTLPIPTYFHSASITPKNKMFIFGGIIKDNENYQRTNEMYSVWLTIPKLSEICWEALEFYFPKLKKNDINLLCA